VDRSGSSGGASLRVKYRRKESIGGNCRASKRQARERRRRESPPKLKNFDLVPHSLSNPPPNALDNTWTWLSADYFDLDAGTAPAGFRTT
jgi:hypothetical protein